MCDKEEYIINLFYLTGLENVQSWQSWQSWQFEWAAQQRCLLPGPRASQTSSPEQHCEPVNGRAPVTGGGSKKAPKFPNHKVKGNILCEPRRDFLLLDAVGSC